MCIRVDTSRLFFQSGGRVGAGGGVGRIQEDLPTWHARVKIGHKMYARRSQLPAVFFFTSIRMYALHERYCHFYDHMYDHLHDRFMTTNRGVLYHVNDERYRPREMRA